jgi:hypothetical protein
MNKQLPSWLWNTIAVVSILILGLVDWLTGYDLNFFLFYFMPVSLGAWYVGFGASFEGIIQYRKRGICSARNILRFLLSAGFFLI